MDTEFPESTEIATWTMRVCCQRSRSLMGNYRSLTFTYISSLFKGWSVWPVLIGPKSLLNQWTEVSHLSIHYGFEFEAVGDKWLHETNKEEEECMKPRKQTLTRQWLFKKGRVGISESSTHGALFLQKVLCSLWSRMTFADVNKIKSS